jgi:hypothetical protein
LPNGEGALVPADFNANEARSKVLPLNELSLMAAALPVGVRVVWLLDCSHGVPALNGETRTVEISPMEIQVATPRTVGLVPLDVQNFAAVPPRINCRVYCFSAAKLTQQALEVDLNGAPAGLLSHAFCLCAGLRQSVAMLHGRMAAVAKQHGAQQEFLTQLSPSATPKDVLF